jgi:hypothetical protein
MGDVLDDLEARISRTKHDIAALQTQLVDLEKAAQLLRPYFRPFALVSTHSIQAEPKASRLVTNIEQPTGDLTGLTILEAAERILAESDGEYIDSEEIGRRALARGYRTSSGRNPEGDPAKILKSFAVIMRRNPDKFDRQGKRFCLKQQESPEDQGAPEEPALMDEGTG